MYSLKTAGVFRANPEANLENATRLVDPTTPGTPATDSGDVETSAKSNIQGVKYAGKDGVEKLIQFFHEDSLTQKRIPISLAANVEPETVQAAIHDIVQLHEVDSIVSVTKVGTLLTVEHSGSGTLSAVVVDGVDVALTRAAITGVQVMATAGAKTSKAKK